MNGLLSYPIMVHENDFVESVSSLDHEISNTIYRNVFYGSVTIWFYCFLITWMKYYTLRFSRIFRLGTTNANPSGSETVLKNQFVTLWNNHKHNSYGTCNCKCMLQIGHNCIPTKDRRQARFSCLEFSTNFLRWIQTTRRYHHWRPDDCGVHWCTLILLNYFRNKKLILFISFCTFLRDQKLFLST